MWTWNSFFSNMLPVPMVFSSPSCCSSAVLQWIYTGLNTTHLNHISSTTDVHEGLAPPNWYRICFDFNLDFMTSCNTTLQARIKQQISKFRATERTTWRKRRQEEIYVWLLCVLKRIGNTFKTLQLSDLKCYLRKIKSLSGELELLDPCSNFSANFLHDLGYSMCLSTVTYRKDT